LLTAARWPKVSGTKKPFPFEVSQVVPLAWLVAWCATCASLCGAELVTHASMEKYHGYAYLPGWDVRTGTAAGVNTQPANARTGSNSLKFDLTLGNGPWWAHEPFAVRPGETNQVRFWYKVNAAVSSGSAEVAVRWWGDAARTVAVGRTNVQTGLGSAVTTGWQVVTQQVVVPLQAAFADLCVDGTRCAGPSGSLYFDDFSMGPVASSTRAINLRPLDGAMDVPLHAVLQWQANPAARHFHLYVGTNYPAVAVATTNSVEWLDSVRTAFSTNAVRYAVTLRPAQQYFWRLDVVDGEGTRWPGDVQSFQTGFSYLENVSTATASRFGAKDDQGIGLDAIKIMQNPTGPGYLGVYHHLMGSQFEVRLAVSTNLLDWKFVRTLEPNGSQPTLAFHASSGGYVLAHEQWSAPGSTGASQLRFRYYSSYANLLAGTVARSYLAPISGFHSTALEGTPNIMAMSADGNVISVGFHYYSDQGVDRNATGTLNNLLTGTTAWTSQVATGWNKALTTRGVTANIGDRDLGSLFGANYLWQEGQYVVGDFGTWRGWFYDFSRATSYALFPKTPKSSRSLGNGTFGLLTAPNGKPILAATYFIFGEQAGAGEAGELIFYTEINAAATEGTAVPTARAGGFDVHLRWLSGAGAASHDIYLGTQAEELASATLSSRWYRGRSSHPHGEMPQLLANTTYFVRVDEVTSNGIVTAGAVWSFMTPPLPKITEVRRVGETVTTVGEGGLAGDTCYLQAAPELAGASSLWEAVATNQFDGTGRCAFSRAWEWSGRARFFRLQLP